jgi:putative hydrolase of the HAD superfamily
MTFDTGPLPGEGDTGGEVIQQKYKAVIFDLFGTLVEIFSRREYEDTLAAMAAVLKIPYDEFYKRWMQTAGQRTTGLFRTLEDNLEYICRELNVTVSLEQINTAKQIRFNFVARALTPRRDAVAVLSRLKSAGYKIGLISNCSGEPPLLWPGTPFAPLFDVAIFSSAVGLQKPDPQIFLMAMQRLEVEPLECLYVGDGDSDELTAAANMGMSPVLIQANDEDSGGAFRSNTEIDKCPCRRISSLTEILDLVR